MYETRFRAREFKKVLKKRKGYKGRFLFYGVNYNTDRMAGCIGKIVRENADHGQKAGGSG